MRRSKWLGAVGLTAALAVPIGAATLSSAPVALAWPAPTVTGDCDGWFVTETATDGDWYGTAYWSIDGAGQYPRTAVAVQVLDSSDVTSRKFTVSWHASTGKTLDTRSTTGIRDLSDCDELVDPVLPTLVVSEECGVEDSVIIPSDPRYQWVEGTSGVALSGTIPLGEGQVLNLEARPNTGFVIDPRVDISYIGSPVEDCPEVVNPVFPTHTVSTVCGEKDTVSFPDDPGYEWYEVVSGVILSGTISLAAGQVITMEAEPNTGFVFEGPVGISYTGSPVEECPPPPPPPPVPPLEPPVRLPPVVIPLDPPVLPPLITELPPTM